MRLVIILISFLLAFRLVAQTGESHIISGYLNPGAPVQAADCFLKNNEHLGTMTDTSGYFQLTVPLSMAADTLVILALGFERKEVALWSIISDSIPVDILLQEKTILLNEVVIESEGTNLKEMVLMAIERIPQNYPNRKHQLIGLYRKLSTQDDHYTHLEEALVTVEDSGYKGPLELVRIRTEHFRESHDWGNVDSAYISASQRMSRSIAHKLNTAVNPLYRLYEGNFIRLYNKENTFFNLRMMKKLMTDHYTFELMDLSISDGDTICQIAFAESVVPPPPAKTSGRSYLKISTTDHAIVEAQFTRGGGIYGILSLNHVRFRKEDGRYYPVYMKYLHARHINRSSDDEEYDIHAFYVDEVRSTAFQKVRAHEVDDRRDPNGHRRKSVNSGFWGKTPLVKRYPLDRAVMTDLEKYETLEEQFQKHAVDLSR